MTTPDTIAPTAQYTTTEACSFLGVHRTTLYRYVQRGVLRCSYRRGNGRPDYMRPGHTPAPTAADEPPVEADDLPFE